MDSLLVGDFEAAFAAIDGAGARARAAADSWAETAPAGDVYARLARSVRPREREWRFRAVPAALDGDELARALLDAGLARDRAAADRVLARLVADGRLALVAGGVGGGGGEALYRLARDHAAVGPAAAAAWRLDRVAHAMRAAVGGVAIKPRYFFPRWVPACFKGSDACAWLQRELAVDADAALAVGTALLDAKRIAYVSPLGRAEFAARSKSWYRFAEDEEEVVLNGHADYSGPLGEPGDVAHALLARLLDLVGRYVRPRDPAAGPGRVHALRLPELVSDPEFDAFADATLQLRDVAGLDALAPPQRVAFWLNVYNLLALHTHLLQRALPLRSVRARIAFFTKKYYIVSRQRLCLDDVEHGILRGNRAFVRIGSSVLPYFDGADPRRAWSVAAVDPRVHFALFTGARSSPAVYLFTPANVDRLLAHAALHYLGETVQLDHGAFKMLVPPCFKWYAPDFGDSVHARVDFIANQLPRDTALAALGRQRASLSLVYGEYDWDTLVWVKPIRPARDAAAELAEGAALSRVQNKAARPQPNSRTPAAAHVVLTLSSVLEPAFGAAPSIRRIDDNDAMTAPPQSADESASVFE